MFDLLCLTDRTLCREPFLDRVAAIAAARPAALILREKDLPEPEYKLLAARALALCRRYGVECAVHNFPQTAKELGAPALHLPLPRLRALSPEDVQKLHALFPTGGQTQK